MSILAIEKYGLNLSLFFLNIRATVCKKIHQQNPDLSAKGQATPEPLLTEKEREYLLCSTVSVEKESTILVGFAAFFCRTKLTDNFILAKNIHAADDSRVLHKRRPY